MDWADIIKAATGFVSAVKDNATLVVALALIFVGAVVFLLRTASPTLRFAGIVATLVVIGGLAFMVVAATPNPKIDVDRDDPNREVFLLLDDKISRALEQGCILFESDQYRPAKLPGYFQSKLEAVVGKWKDDEETTLIVEGYVEPTGTREYLIAMGEKRALAVKDMLVALGFNPRRVRTISYGKERDKDVPRIGPFMCGAAVGVT